MKACAVAGCAGVSELTPFCPEHEALWLASHERSRAESVRRTAMQDFVDRLANEGEELSVPKPHRHLGNGVGT